MASDAPPSWDQQYIRGIYSADDETDAAFKEVVTFTTAAECKAWYAKHQRCTNPAYPQCRQIYTHLCDWDQVCEHLLKPLAKLREAELFQGPAAPLPDSNVFKRRPEIVRELTARLDLPFHRRVGEESTLNTLRYLFFHMRCGIFVAIRGGRLRMFVPFVNKDYRNTWGGALALEDGGSVEDYVAKKKGLLGSKEEYIKDPTRWWANGNIICNVESPDFWGDNYLPQLRHMFETLCARRAVPDAEFFINKRDFPHLARDLSEPYAFIYDSPAPPPLSRERYSSYAPVASFFCGAEFADLPLVSTDDWESATGRVFPPNATDLRSAANRSTHAQPWASRTPTAVFRGNATGAGTDPATNQRLLLAQMSAQWKRRQDRAVSPVDGHPFLDAGVVSWNELRDRKVAGRPMTFTKKMDFDFGLVQRIPMFEQMRYKYQLYVDGHCAAMRYASMMCLGAVIMKVDSVTKADSMWFFPLLRPYDWRSASPDPSGDHVRVAADLSDLFELIAWAKAHDAECERIAANAGALYTSVVAQEGQLDYMQLLVHEISSRFRSTATAPAAVALSTGCRPPLLAPALWDPSAGCGADWFGAANTAYASVRVGGSGDPPMCVPGRATRGCPCPRCAAKADAARALPAEAPPAMAAPPPLTKLVSSDEPLVPAAGAGSSSAPVAGTKRPRPAAAAAAAAPPAPVFVVTDALRQLAKERAARAATSSAARNTGSNG